MNKIRKGDDVIVLAGRDKGKRGKVRCAKMTPMWWSRVSIW
jgi:large subunit ribosomal protein L24